MSTDTPVKTPEFTEAMRERMEDIRASGDYGFERHLSHEDADAIRNLLAAHDAAVATVQRVQAKLKPALSPENQNVINDDLVGMAADVAQIAVSAVGNCELLEATVARVQAWTNESGNAAARSYKREVAALLADPEGTGR